MMTKGIFSADFAAAFEVAVADVFEHLPTDRASAPSPVDKVSDIDIPDPGAPALAAPDLPDAAADAASEHVLPQGTSLNATVIDLGPLYAPGGGGGKPDNGSGGGGGGKPDKGDGGGNTPYATYISGDTGGTSDALNIELQFYGDYSSGAAANLMAYLEAAAEFLSSVITTGFTDDDAMFNSFDTGTAISVDDLLVEVYIEKFKGRTASTVAAETEIFAGNDWNGNGIVETPTGAKITFNQSLISTLDTLEVLDDTALHEMMHTLFFGFWGVAENDLTTTSGGQITYTGSGANGKIVEDEGLAGSVGGHWAEAVYDREVMTSIIENTDDMYLADYSLLSLTDLAVVAADGTTGYTLSNDWQTQLAALNATDAADLDDGDTAGIDLSNWLVA